MVLKKIFSKKNRALLRELVITDFKLRYQGSALGYAWSLLRPLLMFAILYAVFVKFLHLDYGVPNSGVYLFLGIVIWSFFAEMTSLSVGSIVGRGDLIRKIRIPRWIIVISSSVTALINFALNLVVVVIFMFVTHADLLQTALLFPLIMVEVYILALGTSLFLSAAFVKFRDVSYIWEVLLQLMFYITPIIYPLSRITDETLRSILMLNPMAQAIQDSRYLLVSHKVSTVESMVHNAWVFVPYVLPVLVLVSGLLYFRKQAKHFAENI